MDENDHPLLTGEEMKVIFSQVSEKSRRGDKFLS
jgi:hypothetical protein